MVGGPDPGVGDVAGHHVVSRRRSWIRGRRRMRSDHSQHAAERAGGRRSRERRVDCHARSVDRSSGVDARMGPPAKAANLDEACAIKGWTGGDCTAEGRYLTADYPGVAPERLLATRGGEVLYFNGPPTFAEASRRPSPSAPSSPTPCAPRWSSPSLSPSLS